MPWLAPFPSVLVGSRRCARGHLDRMERFTPAKSTPTKTKTKGKRMKIKVTSVYVHSSG